MKLSVSAIQYLDKRADKCLRIEFFDDELFISIFDRKDKDKKKTMSLTVEEFYKTIDGIASEDK